MGTFPFRMVHNGICENGLLASHLVAITGITILLTDYVNQVTGTHFKIKNSSSDHLPDEICWCWIYMWVAVTCRIQYGVVPVMATRMTGHNWHE